MKESYRAHYLLTSLAVVKRTCFDQSTGMWVRVQDENTAITYQNDGNLSRSQTTRDMWTQIDMQIGIELKTRQNANSHLKQSMSILCNYYNMQFVFLFHV